jgi:hypothetical protein
MSHSCRGRVIAYGCLIRKGARREHLDYIYRGLMSHHHQRASLICDIYLIRVCHERQLPGLERKAKVEGSQLRLYKAKEGSRKHEALHA